MTLYMGLQKITPTSSKEGMENPIAIYCSTLSGCNVNMSYGNVNVNLTSSPQIFDIPIGTTITFTMINMKGWNNYFAYRYEGGAYINQTNPFNVILNSTIKLIEITASSSSGGGCCIPYYTNIKYSNGITKFANEVQIGDKLLGYNEKTSQFIETEVLGITEVLRKDLIRVETKTKSLDLTVDHPIYTNKGWSSYNPKMTNSVYSDVEIPFENKLSIAMKLLTETGEYEDIISIKEIYQPENIVTYTYDVTNGIDTYITNGFISHNHN